MKILLAEDDPNISTIAKMALEHLGGHTVVHVANGEAALSLALSDDSFDVILLDEMMPKLNGLATCREYQTQCESPKPVIFLSAKSQESDIKEFNELGLGYIPKPFDPTTLCAQISEIIQNARLEAAS